MDVHTFTQARNGCIVLELVEGALKHVLRIDFLNSQQVQHHVVGEMEGTVEWVGQTLKGSVPCDR